MKLLKYLLRVMFVLGILYAALLWTSPFLSILQGETDQLSGFGCIPQVDLFDSNSNLACQLNDLGYEDMKNFTPEASNPIADLTLSLMQNTSEADYDYIRFGYIGWYWFTLPAFFIYLSRIMIELMKARETKNGKQWKLFAAALLWFLIAMPPIGYLIGLLAIIMTSLLLVPIVIIDWLAQHLGLIPLILIIFLLGLIFLSRRHQRSETD